MSGYNSKSCSSLEKAYYTPLEAALRWCNLIAHEVMILTKVGDATLPAVRDFPQWPCLRVNAEKILSATMNHELPYGRDGRAVPDGEQVAKHRLTIAHNDLKAWITKYYPNQKPAFLFDEVERQLHSGITIDAYQALLAEKTHLSLRLDDAVKTFREQKSTIEHLQGINESLKKMVDTGSYALDARAEKAYLNIIGALVNLILGTSSGGQKHSIFNNQAAIISTLLGYYEGKYGISSTNLESKFAAANRSIKE